MTSNSATWCKSGYRKSSYSGGSGGNCLEAGSMPGAVLVRDTTQQGAGPVLRVSPGAWKTFTQTIK